MGGFLYVDKRKHTGNAAELRPSLEVFEKRKLTDGRGLSIKEVIENDRFAVYLYGKIACRNENILHCENGDFVLNTGTLIYKKETGLEALSRLYTDFEASSFEFTSLQGQFCILLSKGDQLYIWSDLFGIYHVFTNADRSVVSSSFLAVVRQLKSKQLDIQAMYEYVFEGASYNDNTYIQQVELLDAFYLHELMTAGEPIRKKHSIPVIESRNFAERVELTVEHLVSYFETLKGCFGDAACSALSGGYDSRLIVALLSRVKMEPRLYVYGAELSPDVRIAREIADGEQLEILHDSKNPAKLTLDQFQQVIHDEFFFADGHGPVGVFSNGAEQSARTLRSSLSDLQLNGGGGEIFRNFWMAPDKPIAIDGFLKSRFDRLPQSSFRKAFDKNRYLLNLQEKVQRMLQINNNVMTRQELEKLYVYMRVKYWMGYNTSIQNLRGHALIPLTEPIFALSGFTIPFEHKEMGRFEGALIRSLNPGLAAYDSAYGRNFIDKPGVPERFKNLLELHLPVSLKRHLRRMAYRYASARLPYYLEPDYVSSIGSSGTSCMSDFFDLEEIRDPRMVSRIHTVDLVLSDPF